MNIIEKKIKKTLKLGEGKEAPKAKKTATLRIAKFETLEQVSEVLGDSLAAFAAIGYRQFCKAHALATLTGGKKPADLKAQLRNLKTYVEGIRLVTDFSEAQAQEMILAKPEFAACKAYLESLSGDKDYGTLDYVTAFPIPDLFAEDEDEDEESTETED